MIKKLSGKSGMTLMEMMVSIAIVALLAVGMNTGMMAGMRVFTEASADSRLSALASNINTALTDILRYADVKEVEEAGAKKHVMTNLEYGLRDAYIEKDTNGILQIYFWTKRGTLPNKTRALVNSGYYYTASSGANTEDPPNFIVTEFSITPQTDTKGTYFDIRYTIANAADASQVRKIETAVRPMVG